MNGKDKYCGNCKYHRKKDEEWICDNHDGEYFGMETMYDDRCPDYEERE